MYNQTKPSVVSFFSLRFLASKSVAERRGLLTFHRLYLDHDREIYATDRLDGEKKKKNETRRHARALNVIIHDSDSIQFRQVDRRFFAFFVRSIVVCCAKTSTPGVFVTRGRGVFESVLEGERINQKSNKSKKKKKKQ